MKESAKNVVSRFWEEVYNQENLDAVDHIFAPGFVLHDPANPSVEDLDGLKNLVSGVRGAFPGSVAAIEVQTKAEHDKIVTRFVVRGPWAGGGTNEQLEIRGISISRVSRGRIEETWINWDALSLAMALGLMREGWLWPPWRW